MSFTTPHKTLVDRLPALLAHSLEKELVEEKIIPRPEVEIIDPLILNLPDPFPEQSVILDSPAKRKVIRAGRRFGKTIIAAMAAVHAFASGRRVLYAVPTSEQIDRFWATVKQALQIPIDDGTLYKNESRHIIELVDTEQRIRAKTAWNADTLRGDYADLLILDEYQGMDKDAWQLVGAPMLLDNNGDAVFIYTTRAGQKGSHARSLFKYAEANQKTGRWATYSYSSHVNPHLSQEALDEITTDMTRVGYQMEIMALEQDDDPDALWTRELITTNRVLSAPPLSRIVVGVDPTGSVTTECGIVVAGSAMIDGVLHAYVLGDYSLLGKPTQWGKAVVRAYRMHQADRVLGEANYGGDMVESTIEAVVKGDVDASPVAYKKVTATRGKALRAEPISALYEKGLVHHVGEYDKLEDEQCMWVPERGMLSPNRLDALVWAITELLMGKKGWARGAAR